MIISGLVFVLSLIISLFIIWRLYKNNLSFVRAKISLDEFLDSGLFFLLSFGIGARILYIIEHWQVFGGNIASMFLFLHFPGFSFLGGVIGAVLGLWILCRIQKEPFLLLLDTFVVGLAFVLAVAQIGTMEGIFTFCIFAFLYYFYRTERLKSGEIFLYFLTLIGILHFFVVYLTGFSIAYVISAIFAIIGLSVILFIRRVIIISFIKEKLKVRL
ncbi:prolipoprotein diacylglyceryl transferase [Candidatus Microgenomates bacterium]|nr:prolipoprotein diacylglyceryl transferase [Candidatus Microgenomates bacterium]